ncbi:hypothetical protein A4G26_22820 [Mycobacterium kansasii]|nr:MULTISPECIES: hypothetical protein [Mycobacterium]KZS75049.1 hypothetical protein A4G26_22820 [Mycobacterium kansasii]
MSVVRAELAPKFYFGDDAVLLAMDTAGVNTVLAAPVQAERQGSSQMAHDGKTHEFLIDPGAADIELHDDKVLWRLDDAKAIEIVELLAAMIHSTTGAGHCYVDISAPTETLVLSRNEYV